MKLTPQGMWHYPDLIFMGLPATALEHTAFTLTDHGASHSNLKMAMSIASISSNTTEERKR